MNKRNLVLHTAIASAMMAMMGSASAVTAVSTTAVTYANEQFLGTTPGAAVVAPTINIITGVAIPAGSTVTILVELSGGILGVATTANSLNSATVAADTVTTPAFTLGSAPAAGAVVVGIGSTISGSTTAAVGTGVTPSAAANNANVLRIVLTNTGVAIGIGGTVATIYTPTLNAAGLATIGAAVNGTASIFVGTVAAPVGAAVPSTPLLDAASTATAVAKSAKGITIAATANTSIAKIDLTSVSPSTVFTAPTASLVETGSTTQIKLGTITVTDGTARVVAAGNAAYATGAKTTVATLTAPVGFFAALGTTGVLTVRTTGATACVGAVVGTSSAFSSAAAASAATSVSTAAANFTGAVAPGTPVDVCMSVNGTTAIVAGTPVLTATLGAAAAQDSTDTFASATNLYTLTSNGQTADVRSYVPAGTTGYTSFVRIINTGSLAAPVTGQWIYENGTFGTAATLIASHAAGAASTMTSTQIEAALGAPTVVGGNRPRLRVTAPTNSLNVQSFMLTNANGNFSDVTGAQ